jgi:hypothetical protein
MWMMTVRLVVKVPTVRWMINISSPSDLYLRSGDTRHEEAFSGSEVQLNETADETLVGSCCQTRLKCSAVWSLVIADCISFIAR